MMDLSQYRLETLRASERYVLYRGSAGQSLADAPNILLLSPLSPRPERDTIERIEHEYALRQELDSTWAVQPIALTHYRGQVALVLEDPGGDALDRLLPSPMNLTHFLRFASGLARALSQLHKRGLVHKDLKPANILWNSVTGEVRLMGFGITSRLPRERQSPKPPEFIAGTLPYMAPEQTGRMNRSIDSRSDLYSLGVTLYEILTGSLPFAAADPMEWVHCHLARLPTPPSDRGLNIPAPVSALIMKLLAKIAEERYQTAAGVESDLRICLAQLEAEGRIDDFTLGEYDRPDRLMIPEKLYGRAEEIEILVAAFDRVVSGGVPELVLVSGYSGVGKSSVVNELHKFLVPPRGMFASGKFDQLRRDIPYSTLAQAFQGLVRPLLGKDEDELAHWREAFQQALGPNGQLIVDLVPEMKAIIGDQESVPDLPTHDAHRRFQFVIRQFLSVFARPEHPLALFLDDLQWLDPATLELLDNLLTHFDNRHLLLIGAYRDNEVTATHVLMRTLEAMRGAGAPVQSIVLAPLTRADVNQLTADSLHSALDETTSMARLVFEKTGGNPFFVIQFLSELVDERLLIFDHGVGRWSWDLTNIQTKGYTDNVIDLMVSKLNRLSINTQQVVQQFACVGNVAPLALLAMVRECSKEELDRDLDEALQAGLVLSSEGSYRFLHDRVQEAAYSMIPESLRAEAHLRIGRLLAVNTPPEKREEAIFEIVNQLNRGSVLITSQYEKERVAELNLFAGKRAKASTAYASALSYLVAGAALLSDDGWEQRPDLMFPVELNRADCEYATGQLEEAEERLNALAIREATLVERTAVDFLRIDLYIVAGKARRAIEVGLEYLRDMGVEWSMHPSEQEVRREYEEIWSRLGTRTIEELVDLPLISDQASVANLEMLTQLGNVANNIDNKLFALATCRAVNISLEQGNCEASCIAYIGLGTIASGFFGDYQAAYRFGRVGYELVEQRKWRSRQPRVWNEYACQILPWVKPLKACRELLFRSIEVAELVGNLVVAAGGGASVNVNMLAAGDRLDEVEKKAKYYLELSLKMRFSMASEELAVHLGLVRTLRGLTSKFGHFDDEQYNEAATEHRFTNDPNLRFAEWTYWVRKLQARFFAGDYTTAIEASLRTQQLLRTSLQPVFDLAEYHFYTALSYAASWESATQQRRRQHLENVGFHQRQLYVWAQNCPETFENRASLVGAEIARLEGREVDAERLYETAIRSARVNGFIHHEALANELAARFYAARGLESISTAFLRNARYGYLQWGAEGKVRQLDQLFPDLKTDEPSSGLASTIAAPTELLDLATVIKVSQAISSDMVLDRVIDRLTRAAIEYAGAQRGVLILSRNDELRVAAEATTGQNEVIVHLRESKSTSVALPESIIRYIERTHESVILDDACARNPFSADPYILQNLVRSILVLPLVNQAKLAGILYLENNLASHVFTSDRVTILKVLATQAAIVLENARLYKDLEDRESRIRRLVEANIIGIVIWDVDGRIIDANDAFLIMLGHSREDLVAGRLRWTDLSPPEYLGRDFQEMIPELKIKGTVPPFEKEHFRKDGSRVPILVGVTLFQKGGNEGVGFVLDLSEQKRAEAEIRTLKDQLYKENLVLRDEVDRTSMFEEIVGTSKALQPVLSRITKVAPTDSTVFITGETGTGKELIARALHKRSHRAGRAFVSVNCGALAPSLISSELFGHEKGAFTGAEQRRLGRFELADGGTIFLDEVGDLPPDTQVALLRVLQEREFERLGGTQAIRVDVRVIAATNRDLKAGVVAGTFRQDLYYRLNVFPIEVPPLRNRKEDILMLVEYFVQRYAGRSGKHIKSIDKNTLELLTSYSWPGNIRELQNVIERSMILSSSEVFAVDESWFTTEPSHIASRISTRQDRGGERRGEREIIEAALAESKGRVSGPFGAAVKLGIPASTLEFKIRSLKIRKSDFRFS